MCEWSEWLVSWDARAIVRVVGAATQMKVSVFVGRCNNAACTCLLMLSSLSYRRCLRLMMMMMRYRTTTGTRENKFRYEGKSGNARRDGASSAQRSLLTCCCCYCCWRLQLWTSFSSTVPIEEESSGGGGGVLSRWWVQTCLTSLALLSLSLALSFCLPLPPLWWSLDEADRVPLQCPLPPSSTTTLWQCQCVCVQWRWKAAKRRRRQAVHFCNALPSHCHYCNLLHWILLPWRDCPAAQAHYHNHHPLSWLPETRKWKSLKSAPRAHIRSRQFFCLNYSQQSWASLAS